MHAAIVWVRSCGTDGVKSNRRKATKNLVDEELDGESPDCQVKTRMDNALDCQAKSPRLLSKKPLRKAGCGQNWGQPSIFAHKKAL